MLREFFRNNAGKLCSLWQGQIPDLRGDASLRAYYAPSGAKASPAKLNSRSQMIMLQMKYACPVCGYGGLYRPPRDYYTCPCCGTEFGYDDYAQDPQELRRRWVVSGAVWFSKTRPAPPGWSAFMQLLNANLAIQFHGPQVSRTTVLASARDHVQIPLQVSAGLSANRPT